MLSIDANETIKDTPIPKPNSAMSMSETLGLINLTTNSTSHQEIYTGCRCIDFCFITPNILPATKPLDIYPKTAPPQQITNHITLTLNSKPYLPTTQICHKIPPSDYSNPPYPTEKRNTYNQLHLTFRNNL